MKPKLFAKTAVQGAQLSRRLWLNGLLVLICLAAAVVVLVHLRPAPATPTLYLSAPRAAERTLAPLPQHQPLEGAVSVNTAGEDELSTLPGIGPALAQEIIRERLTHGRFYYPEDLLSVKGIGEKKLSQMLPYIILD